MGEILMAKEDAKSSEQNLVNTIKGLSRERKKAAERKNSIEEEMKSTIETLRSVKNRNKNLETQIRSLKKKLSGTEKELEQQDDAISALQETLKSAEDENRQAEADYTKTMNKERRAFQAKLDKARKDLEDAELKHKKEMSKSS